MGGADPRFEKREIAGAEAGGGLLFKADFDSDGRAGFGTTSSASGSLASYGNSGPEGLRFTHQSISSEAEGVLAAAAADMDADGDGDLLTATISGGLLWHENLGGAIPRFSPRPISPVRSAVALLAASDLDLDGDADFLAALDGETLLYESDGASPPGFRARPILASGLSALALQVTDLDRDPYPDILVAWDDGSLRWYQNDGLIPAGFREHFILSPSAVSLDDPVAAGRIDVFRPGRYRMSVDLGESKGQNNDFENLPVELETVIDVDLDWCEILSAPEQLEKFPALQGIGLEEFLAVHTLCDKELEQTIGSILTISGELKEFTTTGEITLSGSIDVEFTLNPKFKVDFDTGEWYPCNCKGIPGCEGGCLGSHPLGPIACYDGLPARVMTDPGSLFPPVLPTFFPATCTRIRAPSVAFSGPAIKDITISGTRNVTFDLQNMLKGDVAVEFEIPIPKVAISKKIGKEYTKGEGDEQEKLIIGGEVKFGLFLVLKVEFEDATVNLNVDGVFRDKFSLAWQHGAGWARNRETLEQNLGGSLKAGAPERTVITVGLRPKVEFEAGIGLEGEAADLLEKLHASPEFPHIEAEASVTIAVEEERLTKNFGGPQPQLFSHPTELHNDFVLTANFSAGLTVPDRYFPPPLFDLSFPPPDPSFEREIEFLRRNDFNLFSRGSLQVTVETKGDDIDPNGYDIEVRRLQPMACPVFTGMLTKDVASKGAVTFDYVENYTVPPDFELPWEPAWANPCQVAGAKTPVVFPFSAKMPFRFSTLNNPIPRCEPADHFLAGAGGVTANCALSALPHSIELTDLAENCFVAGPHPLNFQVLPDETVERIFNVECLGLNSVSVLPTGQAFSAAGGVGMFTVRAFNNSTWTITNVPDWVHFENGAMGMGIVEAPYTVDPNPPDSDPREAVLTVMRDLGGAAEFRIEQDGAPPGPAGGHIETLAGNGERCPELTGIGDGGLAKDASLCAPWGLASDADGNVYIADRGHERVRRVDSKSGGIDTVAGVGGAPGFSGDGGQAVRAELDSPYGIALGPGGNLYIADQSNNRVRRIDLSTGIITTVAGSGTRGSSDDGFDGTPAIEAMLNDPWDVAVDGVGNFYIAESGNHRVLKVDAVTKTIETILGGGDKTGDNETGTDVELNLPRGVTVDAAGNVYVSDTFNDRVLRLDVQSGLASIVADADTMGLKSPFGLTVDPDGNLYIAASSSHQILKVSPDGQVETVAGTGVGGCSEDSSEDSSEDDKPAVKHKLRLPRGVAVDGRGNLYLSEETCQDRDRIRRVVGVVRIPPFELLPESATFESGGGKGSVAVTPPNSSVVWDAVSDVEWLTVESPSTDLQGHAEIRFAVEPNTSAAERSGKLIIGGVLDGVALRDSELLITQKGGPQPVSVSPLGSGSGQRFVFKFTHGQGLDQIARIDVLFNSEFDLNGGCHVTFDAVLGQLHLLGATPPGAISIEEDGFGERRRLTE